MNAFVFMPIWCMLIYLISYSEVFVDFGLTAEYRSTRYKISFAILAFFPVFWLASFGEPCADTIAYLSSYEKLSSSFQNIDVTKNGWGFSVFSIFVKKIFGNNPLPFRIIIGLIHSLPIILIFRKYSQRYVVSFFLFVASACYLSWMMNGLRQFMAVTIILGSIPLVLEKKYIWLTINVLIAMTIHQTAFIMLPLIFIASGKPFNHTTMFFVVLSIAAMFIFAKNTSLFENVLVGSEYEAGYALIKDFDDGVSPIRVFINMVPVVLAILDKKRLDIEKDKFFHICVNMSIITFGVSLVAMTTSGILVGRLLIYTQLFNYLIIPKLIEDVFETKSKKVVYLLMIALYLVYYKYELGNYFYYDIDVFGGLR